MTLLSQQMIETAQMLLWYTNLEAGVDTEQDDTSHMAGQAFRHLNLAAAYLDKFYATVNKPLVTEDITYDDAA